MTIGTVALGANAVTDDPGWPQLLAGVLVHQAADLSWAVVFFALGRYWTYSLSPAAIAAIAGPWALTTSAVEYYVLLPRLQPLVPLEVPYWTALSVHVTSAVAYPLFPRIRAWIGAAAPDVTSSAARWTAIVMAVLFVSVAGAELLGQVGSEPEWPFEDRVRAAADREFMASMTSHHAAGVELARAALAGPLSPEAATLARLIIGEQSGEIDLLQRWWQSWVGGKMPHVRHHGGMFGVPAESDVASLARSRSGERERHFLRLMIDHHNGALLMTQRIRDRAADPRLWLFSVSVAHAQFGQVTWMRTLLGDTRLEFRAPRFV